MLNELHRKTNPEKNIQWKFMLNELHRKTDPEKKIYKGNPCEMNYAERQIQRKIMQGKSLLNELHRKTDSEKKYARKILVERTTQNDRSG